MIVARYSGPFEILARIGSIAYEIAFPSCIKFLTVFHVYLLKNYIPNANHVIYWNVIQLETKGEFSVQLVSILGRKFKLLKN